MNLVPVHSAPDCTTEPQETGEDLAMIVNFDLVYCIEKKSYIPLGEKKPAEGSKLHIIPPGGTGGSVYFHVKESRVALMRMLGAQGGEL